jgi:hypothetical protein
MESNPLETSSKPSARQRVKKHAEHALNTGFWVGVIQLAIEIVKLVAKH